MVLPFYHSGMGDILPKGGRVPRVGQVAHVTVGTPVDLTDLTPRCNCSKYDQNQVINPHNVHIGQPHIAVSV